MTPRELFQGDDLSWLERPDADVESATVERKRIADKKEVARQLSAFANGGGGGGVLIIGIEKDGTIVGVDDRTVDNLIAGVPSCIDACRYEHRTVQAQTGRKVLLFFVPPSPDRVICMSDGSAYQRRGHVTVELNDAQIRELRFARGEERYEDLPAAEWKPDLIDQRLLEGYLDGRRRLNGLTLDLSAEEALRTRQLLVETLRGLMLTNAGVLALAKSPRDYLPGARLRLLRFNGKEEKFGAERNVTKDRWFDGPIPVLMASAREFIRTLVIEFDYLGPVGLFVHEPEYPELVWDEAIVNALVHRSYSLSNTPVYLRIFDDRMEVESPGPFPGPERERQSYPRNPHLMDALRYLELVRWAREGTRRMTAEMQKLGLPPPEFLEPDGARVVVVLRNDLERRRQHQTAPDLGEKWSEVAKLIREPLAFYRQKGLWQWDELVKSGANPPDEVLSNAAAVLMDSNIAEKQRRPFIDSILQSKRTLPKPDLDVLLSAFTQGAFTSASDLETHVGVLLRRDAKAREQLLQWLEGCPPAREADRPLMRRIEIAVYAVQDDLYSREMPAHEHVERLLAILRRHGAAREAQRMFEMITGDALK